MKILFLHQNFPGQFLYLAPEMARRGHDVLALTDSNNSRQSTVKTARYKHDGMKIDPAQTRLGRNYTTMSDRGVTVARVCQKMREQGYYPDVIFGHSGWGETLYLKEIWPKAKLIVYAEFYYMGSGADVGFDTEFTPYGLDQQLIAVGRAAHLGQALIHADAGLSPTAWQASTYPASVRGMLKVIHDGVNSEVMIPNPQATVQLPNGQVVRAGDEVLTFVNRNLEPYRGYHIFMRALPEIMAARPNAQVVIVGGDEVSYGSAPKGAKGWKELILSEVRDKLDMSRVHFMGKVAYPVFVNIMQVSRAHAYLTYPFVLSWSMLESMAAGCLVVGSKTSPVEEVLTHGKTGLLVDFFDVKGWSETLIEALANPEKYQPIREAARQFAVENYDLKTVCLPRLVEFVESFGPPKT
ncbi:glycosyltransferase [Thioclava sp. FR2]|uniref:glycosyltransferase n=1 Tax=Thioclava sp. FR2 TaxID=3445780 RepID=UPI003EB894CF